LPFRFERLAGFRRILGHLAVRFAAAEIGQMSERAPNHLNWFLRLLCRSGFTYEEA
jgi:hypothetical protein